MRRNSDNGYTAARLAEHLKEHSEWDDVQDGSAHWWAPLIDDPETERLLNYYASLWRDRDDEFEETELFKTVLHSAASETVQRAIQQNNLSQLSAERGWDGNSNAGGTRELLNLVDRINEGYIGYLFGHMGTGKTDFAILLAELWHRQTNGTIGTNVKSLKQKDDFVERFENLQDWVSQPGQRLFIFDEASSFASGYSQDAGQVIKYFRKLLRTFRKNKANLLIIGHTGKDVHPDVRRLATDCIHKESKKEAAVYESVENGEGVDQKVDLVGIEPTKWTYNTNEESRWFWES